jgi:lipopolysaccharide transport system ATP-binding protein
MSDIVIRAEHLGKRYRIGERERYFALRDVLTRALTAPARLFQPRKPASPNGDATHIWALKDVSFEVGQGEVVGIIGRNGSGKTTLLKILAQVTRPTEGHAQVRGRVGSLLEVGTGFHPELTGRENVFLSGAILGMSKAEILRKFDEIVAFSEVEKFIDTPLKHYSTGMQMRLAFAVAAHLEPEILLVDEVLAVGDAAFQKKCLGKMGDVAKQGRTVLFVSHSMAAVSVLCTNAIVLDGGRISTIGPTQEAIAECLGTAMDRVTTVYNVENAPRYSKELTRAVQIIALELKDCPTKLVPADADFHLLATVRGNEAVNAFRFGLSIYRIDGLRVGTCFGPPVHSIQKGDVAQYRLKLANFGLAPGLYSFGVGVGTGNEITDYRELDGILDVLHFEMLPPLGNDGTRSVWNAPWWGSIRLPEPVTTKCD